MSNSKGALARIAQVFFAAGDIILSHWWFRLLSMPIFRV